ncbi:MAG: hypothetical protein ACRC0Q_04385 [Kurthia gibsonii]
MIKNSRMLKKKLVNEAKRALRKKGIKILATMVGLSWAVAIDVFGTGFYHGWKKVIIIMGFVVDGEEIM